MPPERSKRPWNTEKRSHPPRLFFQVEAYLGGIVGGLQPGKGHRIVSGNLQLTHEEKMKPSTGELKTIERRKWGGMCRLSEVALQERTRTPKRFRMPHSMSRGVL
mmetsp:Transcript_27370/g.55986  ORF Transcript_27370/g.55986 Transcript_27370/m.55986 type:complete len:105 (+) Transcript_27370:1792-2106(+)